MQMSKDGFYQSLYNYALKRFSVLFLGHETTVIYHTFQFSQFSHSVMSDSLQTHGLQYARLPCPSPTLGGYSDSHPWSQRCHPTISSSVVPFSFHLQSFPASGLFKGVGSSRQVAKVLEFYLQHQSFQ